MSLLKSTLSLMAFTAFIFVLLWSTYSIVTGNTITLPDWAIALVSSVISSYVTARLPNTKTEEQLVDKSIHDTNSIQNIG